MNLLAHAYLSTPNASVLLGNMLGDDVKGMQIKLYPPGLRVGIQLHRYIDSFTDAHPLISEIKEIFQPAVGLYSGAIVDISMDYFLSNDSNIFTPKQWQGFARWAYKALETQQSWHIGGFKQYFPYLVSENWFTRYADEAFIEQSMRNLLRRVGKSAAYPTVKKQFEREQGQLAATYQAFFPLLRQHCQEKLPLLIHENGWHYETDNYLLI